MQENTLGKITHEHIWKRFQQRSPYGSEKKSSLSNTSTSVWDCSKSHKHVCIHMYIYNYENKQQKQHTQKRNQAFTNQKHIIWLFIWSLRADKISICWYKSEQWGQGLGWFYWLGTAGEQSVPPHSVPSMWIILSWKQSRPKRLRKKLWPSPSCLKEY